MNILSFICMYIAFGTTRLDFLWFSPKKKKNLVKVAKLPDRFCLHRLLRISYILYVPGYYVCTCIILYSTNDYVPSSSQTKLVVAYPCVLSTRRYSHIPRFNMWPHRCSPFNPQTRQGKEKSSLKVGASRGLDSVMMTRDQPHESMTQHAPLSARLWW